MDLQTKFTTYITLQELRKMAAGKKIKHSTEALKNRAGESVKS